MNLSAVIKRNPVASFVMLYLVLNLAVLLLPVAGESAFAALLTLMTIVPTLVAFVVVTVMEGRRGAGAFLRQSFRWRSPLQWYLIALGVGFLIQLGTSILALVTGQITAIEINAPTPFLFILLPFALLEEIGLRGFALRHLLNRHSPLMATLIVGIPWALVHFGLIVLHNPDGRSALWEGLTVLVSAFPHAWIFIRSGRSVLVATVLHWAYNVSGSIVGPSRVIGEANVVGLLLISTCIAAAVLILIDRRLWFTQPGQSEVGETIRSAT